MNSRLNKALSRALVPALLLVFAGTAPLSAQCYNCTPAPPETITPDTTEQTWSGYVPWGSSVILGAELCAGVTYVFHTCNGAGWDTYLALWAPDCGDDLAWNDDWCGLQSLIEFTPTVDGTYPVEISSWGCWDGGDVTLTYQATNGVPDCFGPGECASQSSVDYLHSKVDLLEAKGDSLEAKADSLEVKADSLEVKADVGQGSLDAIEVKLDTGSGVLNALEAKLDAVEAKLDAMQAEADAAEAEGWEEHLCALECMPHLWLPAAEGGHLEEVRDWVTAQVDHAEATGEREVSVARARQQLGIGNSMLANGLFVRACQAYARALQEVSEGCI
jgi:hypothetical protein